MVMAMIGPRLHALSLYVIQDNNYNLWGRFHPSSSNWSIHDCYQSSVLKQKVMIKRYSVPIHYMIETVLL